MPITFTPTAIPEVILIKPQVFEDERGSFYEGYREDQFAERHLPRFVQDNVSYSFRRAVRGLHYQTPPKTQAKLVHAIRGKVYDVAVDIRRSSPTFGRWVGYELSDENHHLLYIPPGFAHGFCTLVEDTVVVYKVSDYYSPQHERGIVWNDPAMGIGWPDPEFDYQMTQRDRSYPLLKNAELG